MAAVIVTIVRLFLPLTILRWPLAGGMLVLLADTFDSHIFWAFGYGFWADPEYQIWDKAFDMWYLSFELYVVWKWTDVLARRTAIFLFSWRFAGFIVFQFTGRQELLLYAPNLFEYFYLWCLLARKFKPDFKMTWRHLAIALGLIGLQGFVREYYMHVLKISTPEFFHTYILRRP